MSTGAESPDKLTHSIVLCGEDLTFSMVEGQTGETTASFRMSKHIENRHVRFAPGWYGLIMGKGKKGVTLERNEECRRKLPFMSLPPMGDPSIEKLKGCVVGVVRISHSLPYHVCKDSEWADKNYTVCNIISHAGWIDTPVPCKGNLGAAPIKGKETLERVRLLAGRAHGKGKLFATGADLKYPPPPMAKVAACRKKRKREGGGRAGVEECAKHEKKKLRQLLLADM